VWEGALSTTLTPTQPALHRRLEERRAELEQTLLARVYGIADPAEIADPAYGEGLRAAVSAAVDYAFATLRDDEDRAPLVPSVLLTQVRLAARHRVPLDTVLRRYTAGHTVLIDLLMEEVERGEILSSAELRRLLSKASSAFDDLLAAVGDEYGREAKNRSSRSRERRRVECVDRLLAGEPVDASELEYEMGGWHCGVIAHGKGAETSLRAAATEAGCRTLLVHREEGAFWAWLGSRDRCDPARLLASLRPAGDGSLAIGAPGEGLSGWRLTHRQAAAALPIAKLRGDSIVRYADVAVLASALGDELLQSSLRRLYVDPLRLERDDGATSWATLRAYAASERNLSSAAAILGVNRRTVANRLKTIEEKIGVPLSQAMLDIEVLTKLKELPGLIPQTVTSD
jgi:PucR-like helix-turn-helix protein/diguanylate cyclase with GGDEF domain